MLSHSTGPRYAKLVRRSEAAEAEAAVPWTSSIGLSNVPTVIPVRSSSTSEGLIEDPPAHAASSETAIAKAEKAAESEKSGASGHYTRSVSCSRLCGAAQELYF